jgi:hypothetical protein
VRHASIDGSAHACRRAGHNSQHLPRQDDSRSLKTLPKANFGKILAAKLARAISNLPSTMARRTASQPPREAQAKSFPPGYRKLFLLAVVPKPRMTRTSHVDDLLPAIIPVRMNYVLVDFFYDAVRLL